MAKTEAPFDDEAKRMELLERLNAIERVSIASESITKRPPVRLSAILDRDALEQLLRTLDWVVDQIEAELSGKFTSRN